MRLALRPQSVSAVEVAAAVYVLGHAFPVHLGEIVERVADDHCGVYEAQVCLFGVGEAGVGAVGLGAEGDAVEAGLAVELSDSAGECEDVDGCVARGVPE